MLSELERLAAMVQDSARVNEIGADQWPLAMIACGLLTSSDPSRLGDNLSAYAIFAQKTDVAARKASLSQLVRFVVQRKGNGWRAMLPYALAEPDPALARKAAMQVLTLAQPTPTERFAGVSALVALLRTRSDCPVTVLDALLDLGDMRFAPILQELCVQLPEEKLGSLLQGANPTPNRLSYSWLLAALASRPALAEQAVCLLERMAPKAEAVLDLIIPIPTWAYEKPAPQPLHGWTRVEYYARLKPGLEPYLNEGQLARVRAVFGA